MHRQYFHTPIKFSRGWRTAYVIVPDNVSDFNVQNSFEGVLVVSPSRLFFHYDTILEILYGTVEWNVTFRAECSQFLTGGFPPKPKRERKDSKN